jgi:hypothetical protein
MLMLMLGSLSIDATRGAMDDETAVLCVWACTWTTLSRRVGWSLAHADGSACMLRSLSLRLLVLLLGIGLAVDSARGARRSVHDGQAEGSVGQG